MKFKLLFSFLLSMLCISQIDAQTATKPWAVGLHGGNSQYSGDFGSSLFDFDPFEGFVGLSVSRRLNSSFDLDFRVQKGRVGHWGDDNLTRNFLVDQVNFGLAAHYKFLGDATFKPYAKAGIGFSKFSTEEGLGANDSDLSIPLGLGFDYAITNAISFNVQTLYGINFGDEFDNNVTDDDNDNFFHHSVGIKYNFGSRNDRDGDGVSDVMDKCPDVPGPRSTMGCPDTDNDGIIDIDDYCPTMIGSKGNNGCPEVDATHIKVMQEALYGVYFDFEKAVVKPESYPILNRVVNIMKNHEYYKLKVEGHTDAKGTPSFNHTLSHDRANAVKSYLVGKGIASDRITSAGYGEKRPVASNDTEEGMAKNRRVEFILSY